MDNLCSNLFMKEIHNRRRMLLLRRFPILSSCPHESYLSLFDYISKIPECFFSEKVFHKYLTWLESVHVSDSPRLKEYLVQKENELSKAFLFLAETNRYAWHDSYEEIDDYETIRFIDQQVNPVYLRLIEAVFCVDRQR